MNRVRLVVADATHPFDMLGITVTPLRIIVLILLLATACSPNSGSPDPTSPAPTSTVSPIESSTDDRHDLGDARCAAVEGGEEGVLVNLADVEVAEHQGFDRVVFEFAPMRGVDEGIPAYRVQTVSPPFTKNPSDLEMDVAGSDFAHINMQGATQMGPDGEDTYGGAVEFKVDFEVLVELEMQGDFEATMDWIAGLDRRSCWRVFELSGPLRLVVEFPH